MFNEVNTVEQTILDACQGLGWLFVPGPQPARQAADVFVVPSCEATTGDSLGRKSQESVPPRIPSRKATTCVASPVGASRHGNPQHGSTKRTPAVVSRLSNSSCSPTSDLRPRLSPATASRLANTVEEMILDACQGPGWHFVPGTQLPRQAADVFVVPSRNATAGDSLGRKSQESVRPRIPSRNATTCVASPAGHSRHGNPQHASARQTPAVALRLSMLDCSQSSDLRPRLSHVAASRLANTVEQMILDACQGLGWQFVPGPQLPRQAADGSSSRNATTGDSLGRESEVTVTPRIPKSQRDDMCPAGVPMIYACVLLRSCPTHAVALRLSILDYSQTSDLRPRLSHVTASRFSFRNSDCPDHDMTLNDANTVEQMILDACQGLGWQFVPGPQLPRQAADVFVESQLRDDATEISEHTEKTPTKNSVLSVCSVARQSRPPANDFARREFSSWR